MCFVVKKMPLEKQTALKEIILFTP